MGKVQNVLILGAMLNKDGETVITQDEYEAIKKLHDLKTSYRENFHNLRQVKFEIFHCQKHVDQSRQRLIQGNLNLIVILHHFYYVFPITTGMFRLCIDMFAGYFKYIWLVIGCANNCLRLTDCNFNTLKLKKFLKISL